MSTKKAQGKINKKDVLVKEREDQWRIEPCKGIPTYVAEKDPHCPSGQIRKFNEEKKLKAQILAQREKATATFIKTTLDHSLEDLTDPKYKLGNDVKSKVKTRESYAEIEILQKIVVRENLLVELHKLVKSQNDVSVCLNEVVELVKALRFQTLDIIEDINAWQQTQPKVRAFEYKGFNYLVKIKCDLDFLDLYEEIVEKFCFEFNSNPLAYRGGGNVITGYTTDPRQKTYSQGLLQSYYSKSEDALLDGLDVTRLHNAEKIIQNEFQRIGREKSRGQELVQQQSQHAHQSNVLDRDIFTALSKSTNSLHIDAASPSTNLNQGHHAHTADGTTSSEAFGVSNNNNDQSGGKKGKKSKRGSKTVINPKKLKLDRIAQLQDEASDLKAMIVNVDEKIRFLTDHHHDLLNQRAALDVRLKEAKSMGRETAAQHIAAEISVNAAVVLDNSTKVKDLQRESYFINLERKRKLGTVQKLKDEMEKDKERAVMQKKIGSLIKKEGLLAALQSLNTGGAKISAKEVAEIGDKTLPRPKSAGAKVASPPKSAGKKSKRESNSDASPTSQALLGDDNRGNEKEKERQMSSSASAPVLPPLHAARQQNHNHQNNVNYVNHNSYGTYIEEGGEGEENGEDENEGDDDEGDEDEGEEDEDEENEENEGEDGGEEGQYAQGVNFNDNYDQGNDAYQQQAQQYDQLQVHGQYNQYQYQDSPHQFQQQYTQEYSDNPQFAQDPHAHYAHGGEGYHQPNAHYDHSHVSEPGQEHHYAGNNAYDQNLYNQGTDSYAQQALNTQYTNNYNPQLQNQQYYGQQLEDQSYLHEEEQQVGHLQQQSTDYSHTDHTYTGYSHVESHTDGDDTLYGETLLDSAHSTIAPTTELANQSEGDGLQMHLSPVRHQHHLSQHHGSSPHGNAYLSPSEGSYCSHTSKDSPLGYSMNSVNSLGDVSDVHPHELQEDHVDHRSHHLDSSTDGVIHGMESAQNKGLLGVKNRANVTAEEHMYISDDEEHAESRPHTSSSPSRNVYGATEANSTVYGLDTSDLSLSPMAASMQSHALDDSYAHDAPDATMQNNPNRELFGDAVSLDGVVEGDYAAGGAYGLVKKLKLSPRPAN